MSKPHIALIGLGLIGSSLGHAFKKHGLAAHISGMAQSAKTRKTAFKLGIVDSIHKSADAAVKHADIIFLNTPLSTYSDIMRIIAPALKDGAIITDVGSVKSCALDDIMPLLPKDAHYVPGHPIAGTEQSGPEAGFAEIFENRWCILTPPPETNLHAIDKIGTLWNKIGCEITLMDAAHHDLILAITSHLPHLIAFNIVGTAANLETDTKSEVIKYSASGFRDFTRLASSDPIMWRDVFLKNKDAILQILTRFNADLETLQNAIAQNDGDALETIFNRTKIIRHSIIKAGQDTAAPDFGRYKK